MYLIRQVAAADATERGRPSLADYYSSKGETPGRWMGRGLPALGAPAGRDPADPVIAQLWAVPEGSEVREDQMKALFGEGLHPNADQIGRHLTGGPAGKAGALAAAKLGRPFRVNSAENEFTRRLRAAYGDYNTTLGEERQASIEPDIRARIRTAVGTDMFTETYGRPPGNDRELSGYIARQSRAADHRRRRLRPHLHPGQIRLGAVGAGPALDVAQPSRTATTKPSPKRWPSSKTTRPSPAWAPTASPRSTPPV